MISELTRSGDLSQGSRELIALARSLGGETCAAMIGRAESVEAAAAAGAQVVHLIEEVSDVTRGGPDARLQCYEQVLGLYRPDLVLVPESDEGAEIGPRLAARMGAAIAQGCSSVEVGPAGNLLVTRPVYGGNAVARLSFPPRRMAIVMARSGICDPLGHYSGPTEVISSQPKLDPDRLRVSSRRTVTQDPAGVSLEDAGVVVGGGRGLGGPEAFGQLRELATALGGAVGASRAACDAGWIDHSFQVGLTGRKITPELYLAFGISGASQHMAGCLGARTIVAINSDDRASIFSRAQFGVVGDWKAVLPAFMAAVMDLRSGSVDR